MVQISFKLAVQATTTLSICDAGRLVATTSGPIKIPYWAPDIAWMATTTLHDQAAGRILNASTWHGNIYPFNPAQSYNKRCFGFKRDDYFNETGDVITLHYRAVGELVRA